jgi:hypothetical protein
MKKKPNDTVEFPDDVEIEGGADYDFADPTAFAGKDPGMRYFFAADDKDAARPDGGCARAARLSSEREEASPPRLCSDGDPDRHSQEKAGSGSEAESKACERCNKAAAWP